LKKLTAKSDQSASIRIPMWIYADEISFLCSYLHESDIAINLEFDAKGKTDEEELLHAESKIGGTAEREEHTLESAKKKLKKKTFWETHRSNNPSRRLQY
jgi:hypothetical protein